MVRVFDGYEAVRVGDITKKKLLKAVKSGVLSLTAADLKGDTVMLLHPMNAKRVRLAQKAGKGVNKLLITVPEITSDIMYHQKVGGSLSGGSVWGWIKNAGKDVVDFTKDNWQIIKPIASAIADKAIPAGFTAIGQPAFGALGRKAFKELTGVGLKEQRLQNLARAREAKKMKRNMGGSFLIN